MDIDNDQVQNDTQDQEAPDGGQVEDKEQSNKVNETEGESKVYDVLGRQLTPDELYEEYQKTQSHITKLSQENAKFKQNSEAREKQAEADTRAAIDKNEMLENVPSDVKEAIVQIVKPVINSALEEREQAEAKAEMDRQFLKELEALEEEFPGGDGKPKFDRAEIIKAMQDPNARIFDPRLLFEHLHKEELLDHQVKQALKQQSSGHEETESTTGSKPKKPSPDSPSGWDDAANRARSRLLGR